jgi:CRISPR-associated protein Cas1
LSDTGRDRLFRLWEEHKTVVLQHKVVGRQVERWALPTIQATLLARHLRGDLPGYPAFVLSP